MAKKDFQIRSQVVRGLCADGLWRAADQQPAALRHRGDDQERRILQNFVRNQV